MIQYVANFPRGSGHITSLPFFDFPAFILQYLQIILTHKPRPIPRIHSSIRHNRLPRLQTPTLHRSPRNRPIELIRTTLNRKISQANLIIIPANHRWQAKVLGFDSLVEICSS